MAKKVFNLEGPVINDASMFGSFYTGKKISSTSADKVVDYLEESDNNRAYIKISFTRWGCIRSKNYNC